MAADGRRRVGCGVSSPRRGGGEALRETLRVSEVGEVAASGPGVDFDLWELFAQPLLVAGLEGVAGDEEVGDAAISQCYKCGGGEIDDLVGWLVEELLPVAEDELLLGAAR